MIVTYQWLKDFVPLTEDIGTVTHALTSMGLEVASVEHMKVPDGLYVAEVTKVAPHPNADRLSVCTVWDGTNEYMLVCGAPNVRVGLKSALAVPGTTLQNGLTVEETKIRGVASAGMLCSEKECGISDEHSGILELGGEVGCGTQLKEYFVDDYIIEIELTPDRGDCLSIRGVARDLAAFFDRTLHTSLPSPCEDNGTSIERCISITIDEPDRCPRYAGRLVQDVTITSSPQWLKTRLIRAGIRPINNIVDITNYVMLHLGHPMHAFDYAALSSKEIRVRTAARDERFTTLDGTNHAFTGEDLLICDGETPVALAGIMGGDGSCISETTRDVFLECAFFEPTGIRKSAKRCGISTDSSHRFERGVDTGAGLIEALDTAAALVAEYAGGRVVAGRLDEIAQPMPQRRVTLRTSRVEKLLGIRIDTGTVRKLLRRLQFEIESNKGDVLTCLIPTFRHDCTIEADLIEEVGRLRGYDSIEPSEYAVMPVTKSGIETHELVTDTLRNRCAYAGLRETQTNSLTSEKKNRCVAPAAKPVDLRNPLSPEMAQMRTSLIISLCDTIAYNLNRNNEHNRFFEIGRVYEYEGNGEYTREQHTLAIALQGEWHTPSWDTQPRTADIYVLKGLIERCIGETRIGLLRFREMTSVRYDGLFTHERAEFVSDDGRIHGVFGKLAPGVLRAFQIKTDVYAAEIFLDGMLQQGFRIPQYAPVSRYPALKRCFCFVMPRHIKAGEIRDAIYSVSPMVSYVHIFDVYEGEKIGAGMKSVAYAVTFRAPDKTLQETEADALNREVISRITSNYNIALREDETTPAG